MRRKPLRISVILPCLNEVSTVAACVRDARSALRKLRIPGKQSEVIVVDNGSTDRSASVARAAGARVIREKVKGYGSAYLTGIRKSHGDIIVIGDSDGTYDFRLLGRLIAPLLTGADLVLGSRFKGNMDPHAMPFLNRYVGNPLLTGMLNICYGGHISDAHTGFRAFTKTAFIRMEIQSRGMVFASEMIVKAIFLGLSIREIPIPYHPRIGVSKLSPLSDAWRHIRFMLLYSPTYAFILPGTIITLTGGILSTMLLRGPVRLGTIMIDVHTMTVGMFLAGLGIQIIMSGLFARGFVEKKLRLHGGALGMVLLRHITSPRLLAAGSLIAGAGGITLAAIGWSWASAGFGEFNRMRETIYTTGLTVIGVQMMFSSFLFGLLEEN